MRPRRPGQVIAAVLGAALVLGTGGPVPGAAAAPWTPLDGVVFVESTQDYARLRLAAVDGSNPVELTDRVDGLFDSQPELSPDGSTVVFVSNRVDAAGGLVVLDGSGLRRLTTNDLDHQDFDPTFTPDGSRVLFTRIVGGSTQLYVQPVAGGAATRVGYTGSEPDVSVDGALAFTTPAGAIRVGSLTGGSSRQLVAEGGEPAWSPTGTELAYVGLDAPNLAPRLHVVDQDGAPDRELAVADADGAYDVSYPQWMPDGQSLVYSTVSSSTSGDRPDFRVYAVDRLGSRAGRVIDPTEQVGQSDGFPVGDAPADVVQAGVASRFVPVQPTRIFDSRPGAGAGPKGKIGPGGTVDVQVAGVSVPGATVPAGATAAVLTITATEGTATTFVTAYPAGSPAPDASTLNPPAGADVPNLATVPIGAGGKITLYNNLGSVHLVADLAGYYVPSAGAGPSSTGFGTVSPSRVYDSRPGEQPGAGPKARLGPGGTVDIAVAGRAGVPVDAAAVVVNLTGIGPTASTFVSAYPTPAGGSAFPATSAVNVLPGRDAASLAVVQVGADGSIRLRNGVGSIDVAVDVAGYYSAGAGGEYVPVEPLRFLDTRIGTGTAPLQIGRQEFVDLSVTGRRGVPAGAVAVVGNLTGIAVGESTFVTAFPPSSATEPGVSNLNLAAGEVRANAAYLLPGETGRVRVLNDRGVLDAVADVSGYFVAGG